MLHGALAGFDEEHGTSAWAAAAQERLAQPLPASLTWDGTGANEFRLVSDEDKIPPYFRPQHRAHVRPGHDTTRPLCLIALACAHGVRRGTAWDGAQW
jgi:hypothetical protein